MMCKYSTTRASDLWSQKQKHKKKPKKKKTQKRSRTSVIGAVIALYGPVIERPIKEQTNEKKETK